MIANDFIMEIPEVIVDSSSISQCWVDSFKPKKRFSILDTVIDEPILNNFVNSFNKNLFDTRIKFMLIRFGPFEEYKPHIDASRYTGINLVIRGNKEKSPIRYYNDTDLNNPVFEYQYKNFPILMTSQRYHSIKNDHDSERIIFTIHFKTSYTFQGIRDEVLTGNRDLLFSSSRISAE